MSIMECAVVLQTSGDQSPSSNTPAAEYFLFTIVALVLGLVVLIFVRSGARRSSKR
jgi:hypothetical protein